jgi:outer membrane lipoprotein carrier protein
VVALLAAIVPAARAGDLEQALERLQQRYEATRTMTARFQQTVEAPTLKGKLESHGTVAFEKPNHMRWDYEAPDRQQIIGDGETLWIYQPDDKQVLRAPLSEAFHSSTPVTFLSGLGHLTRDFIATLETSTADSWVLRLVPRQDSGIGTLRLVVRKPDAAVTEARITDPLGTTTTLALSDEKRNSPLDQALFRFTPPPGVDVVRPPTY